MENNIRNIGYEDTDKKIEIDIYGIRFEIKNIDKKHIEELNNNNNNLDSIEKEIENVLGIGAVKKINDKRIQDGHKEMNLQIEMNILGFVYETYTKATLGGMVNGVMGTVQNLNDKLINTNRENRRNYNKNYRKNNYRGNRRRY